MELEEAVYSVRPLSLPSLLEETFRETEERQACPLVQVISGHIYISVDPRTRLFRSFSFARCGCE